MGNNAASQTLSSAKSALSDSIPSQKSNRTGLIESNRGNSIYKHELPASQKASPEIFYIVNDKPASREEYLKYNKKKQ